jgi:predicted transcriptional regulator
MIVPTQHVVFEPRGYGAMATIVKTFFSVFSGIKILIYQYDSGLCAEIG